MLLTRIGLPLAALGAGAAIALTAAMAQNTPAPALNPNITAADPEGPTPLPASIPFTMAKDIKWPECNGPCRQQQVVLWGNPNQPGPYGLLIKWYPGNFARPHTHNGDRNVYVISGTWWVSSSAKYDLATTYPMRAGYQVTNVANTVHWDGNRAGEKEPAVILLTGIGPVVTTQVDENGKPLPPAGRGAAAPAGRGN